MFEYFLLSMKKTNMTAVFLQPSLDISFQAATTEATNLTAGIADVIVGILPLIPIVVSGMTEPPIPYISCAIKWFVPCPKPISRADGFLTVFDASVWLTMKIVFVLHQHCSGFQPTTQTEWLKMGLKICKPYQNICIMRGAFLLAYPSRRCLDLGN